MSWEKIWMKVRRPLSDAERELCSRPSAINAATQRASATLKGRAVSDEEKDSLLADALLALVEISQEYRPDMGMTFESFIYEVLLYRIRDIRRRESEKGARKNPTSRFSIERECANLSGHLLDPCSCDPDSVDFSDLVDGICARLPEREAKAFRAHATNPAASRYSDLAKLIGCSTSMAWLIIKRAKEIARLNIDL